MTMHGRLHMCIEQVTEERRGSDSMRKTQMHMDLQTVYQDIRFDRSKKRKEKNSV